MIVRASLLIGLLSAVTTTAHAQQLSHDFESFPTTPKALPRLMATPPPTYWLEGGLIGGIGLGTLSAYEAGGVCESGNSTPGRGGAGLPGARPRVTVDALIA